MSGVQTHNLSLMYEVLFPPKFNVRFYCFGIGCYSSFVVICHNILYYSVSCSTFAYCILVFDIRLVLIQQQNASFPQGLKSILIPCKSLNSKALSIPIYCIEHLFMLQLYTHFNKVRHPFKLWKSEFWCTFQLTLLKWVYPAIKTDWNNIINHINCT
jgi:hypothetical protein